MQGQVTSVKAGSTRSEGVDLLGSATVLLIKSLFLRSMDGPDLSYLHSTLSRRCEMLNPTSRFVAYQLFFHVCC